jgi:hypothetical protein
MGVAGLSLCAAVLALACGGVLGHGAGARLWALPVIVIAHGRHRFLDPHRPVECEALRVISLVRSFLLAYAGAV